MGDFTRHASLVMSTNGGIGGPRGAQTQSFNREGRPIPAMNKPKQIFDMLFVTRVVDLPKFLPDHTGNIPKPRRRDPTADVIDRGGSLWGLTHSENGFLMSHDSEFHHFSELI